MMIFESITVGDALDRAAAKWGAAEGWVFERTRMTFAAVKQQSDATAKALIGLGLRKGDVVATWMPNRSEWLLLQMACAKTGIILTGLNTRFKTEETKFVLERGDVSALFYTPRFLNIDFLALLREVVPGVAQHRQGESRGGAFPKLKYLVEFDAPVAGNAMTFAEFLKHGESVSDETLRDVQKSQSPHDAVLMKFTSGTTSFPKGVLVQHLEALYWAGGIFSALEIGPGEPILNTQPFYHAGGSCGAITAPLTLGCKVVTAEYYEPERIMALIEREKCVARTGSAAMYLTEMEHPKFGSYDLSSLKKAWCVAPPAVFERIRNTMKIEQMLQVFGATEAGGTIASLADDWETRTHTCGRPMPGTELRIVDPQTHEPLPAGAIGELSFRGWWKMIGYFKQPEETAATSDPGGWLRTGDLGFIDERGNLNFVGRLKDTIRPGGENVSAREVEAFLLNHPAIQQVAVIGVPDDRLTEVVMAVVETKTGQSLTQAEVVAFCTGKIANYKIPKYVAFTDDWPMTGSGKIQKFTLRERYAGAQSPRSAG